MTSLLERGRHTSLKWGILQPEYATLECIWQWFHSSGYRMYLHRENEHRLGEKVRHRLKVPILGAFFDLRN